MNKKIFLFMIIFLSLSYFVSADIVHRETFENNSIQGWTGGSVESTAPLNGTYSYKATLDSYHHKRVTGMNQNNTFNVSMKFRHDITAGGCMRFGVTNENYPAEALPHIENNHIGLNMGESGQCDSGGDATRLWASTQAGLVDTGKTCAEATTGAGCNVTFEINSTDSGSTSDTVWRFHLNSDTNTSLWYTTKGVLPVRKANAVFARAQTGNGLWLDDIRVYNVTSIILDIISPTFSNAVNTSPNFRRYQNFTANITISDETALDYYIFSTNASGTWSNISTVDISGASYSASTQANISIARGSQVCWKYYANDTSGNMANSSVNCFTVANTFPTQSTPLLNSTYLTLNDTNVNLTAYNQSTADNDNDAVKNIFNWKINGTPIAVLNMPFEGVNGSLINNAWDYSGYGNNGSVSGAVWNATGGYDGKGAYMFDGINDYISYNNNMNSSTKFTITSWIKHNSRPTGLDPDYVEEIIATDGGGDMTGGFGIEITSDGSLYILFNDGTKRNIDSSFDIPLNTYNFISYVFNGTTIISYVNGVQGNIFNVNPTIINYNNTQIGRRTAGAYGYYFNGTIDDVMIFNRSLSPEQINALYKNRTDLIVAQETTVGQNWSVEITPNDGYDDGQMLESNGVLILESPDVTAPTITINNPANNNTNYSTSTILFNSTIGDVSIGTVNFSFNNASGIDFNITVGNWSGLFNVSLSANVFVEGRHLWQVFATDMVGNVNNSAVINFTIDRTSPNITLNFVNFNNLFNASNYSIRTGNITLNVSAFDNLLSVQNIYYLFDNGTGIGFNVTATNFSGNWVTSYNISTLAEGRHGVIIMANDSVNNINNSFIINFTMDFTSPNVTRNFLNNPVDNSNFSIRSSNQTFNASVFDTLTLVDKVYFWFDNGTSNDFNVTGFNNSGLWIISYNISTLAEGKQGVRIIANDTVDNVNNSFVINFTVDFTAPNIAGFIPSSGSTLNGTLEFGINVSDAFLEISTVIFQFSNGTNPFNRTAMNFSGKWNLSINTSSISEGALTITFFANDTVNNMNSTQTLALTIDNIPLVSGGGGGAGSGVVATTPKGEYLPSPEEQVPVLSVKESFLDRIKNSLYKIAGNVHEQLERTFTPPEKTNQKVFYYFTFVVGIVLLFVLIDFIFKNKTEE